MFESSEFDHFSESIETILNRSPLAHWTKTRPHSDLLDAQLNDILIKYILSSAPVAQW